MQFIHLEVKIEFQCMKCGCGVASIGNSNIQDACMGIKSWSEPGHEIKMKRKNTTDKGDQDSKTKLRPRPEHLLVFLARPRINASESC